MLTYKNKNRTLEYTIVGTGKPLVFIHGLGGDINQIQSLYQPIEHIQLILPNMQGHGNSESDYSTLDFNTMADDTICLLKQLQISHADFAGISMGAAIITNIAIRYPQFVDKLILIRPAWTHQSMAVEVQQAYSDLAFYLQKKDKNRYLTSQGWHIVEQTTNYTRNTFLHTFEEPINVKEWQKFEIIPYKAPFTNIKDLLKITQPTAIIVCKQDFVHPYEYGNYYHQHITNSHVYEIPSKDINPLQHKAQINTILKEFLT